MVTSMQKQEFISHYVANGLRNGAKAARAAGFTASTARIRASRILREPEAQAAIAEEQQRLQKAHQLTTDKVVLMLLESYHKSTTATEEIAAVREIAKLVGLYPTQTKVTETHTVQHTDLSLEQLAVMSDTDLLAMAGLDSSTL
mgnify:CR=1 FL=1|jgi:phage terminase small subunit